MTDLPYSYVVRVAELPPDGLDLRLEPDADTLEKLGRYVGVAAMHVLSAHLLIRPIAGDGVHVTGEVAATVRQISVVSLEGFDCDVTEPVDVRFMPEAAIERLAAKAEEEEVDIDLPDPIHDGRIDLGALVTEFLALGVDPYPRMPGEVFETPAIDETQASPFAALGQLKNRS